MRLTLKNTLSRFLIPITSVVLALSGAAQQPPQQPRITDEMIQQTGYLLPTYMSVQDIMAYQGRTGSHRAISLTWEAYPGARNTISADQERQLHFGGVLTLQSVKQVEGGLCKCMLNLEDDQIVFLAVDAQSVVLSIEVQDDALRVFSENSPQAAGRVHYTAHVPTSDRVRTVAAFRTKRDFSGITLVKIGQVQLTGARR